MENPEYLMGILTNVLKFMYVSKGVNFSSLDSKIIN